MKRRIIMACILMLGFTVASLYASYNINYLLLKEQNMYSTNPVVLIHGLSEPRIRTFFMLLVAGSALLIFYMLVIRNFKYKSDMQIITPDIETPKAEGQGQYGTAKWLAPSKFSKVFSIAEVDKGSQRIKELIIHGYDDEREDETCKTFRP